MFNFSFWKQKYKNLIANKCYIKNPLIWRIPVGVTIGITTLVICKKIKNKNDKKKEKQLEELFQAFLQKQYSNNKKLYPERIILVRHGQSIANQNHELYTKIPDHLIPLTFFGKQQAIQAGKKLKEIIGNEKFYMYISPFLRGKQTARNIQKSFPSKQYKVHEDPRIREQEFGNLQRYQFESNYETIDEECKKIGKVFYRYPNGESGADIYDRCTLFLESFFRRIFHPKKHFYNNYIIVSHGLFIQFFLARYFRLPITCVDKMRNPENCEMVILKKEHKDSSNYIIENHIFKQEKYYKDQTFEKICKKQQKKSIKNDKEILQMQYKQYLEYEKDSLKQKQKQKEIEESIQKQEEALKKQQEYYETQKQIQLEDAKINQSYNSSSANDANSTNKNSHIQTSNLEKISQKNQKK